MSLDRPELVDMIRELCDVTENRERYTSMRGTTLVLNYHVTRNPSLIHQLGDAVEPKSSVDAGAMRSAASRPCASLDAIDALIQIDRESAAWLRKLEVDDTASTDSMAKRATDCVRRLASLVPSADNCGKPKPKRDGRVIVCCLAHRIENDIHRWWTWARIITRWDLPAWQPDNTCPLCAVRGTLRVRPVEKLATCTGCRETWDEATIGLLADHIRAENNDDLLTDNEQEAS